MLQASLKTDSITDFMTQTLQNMFQADHKDTQVTLTGTVLVSFLSSALNAFVCWSIFRSNQSEEL